MARKFICVQDFELESYDDEWEPTGEYVQVKKGEVFELINNLNFIGGEFHLEATDGSWIEISYETLKECFEEEKE